MKKLFKDTLNRALIYYTVITGLFSLIILIAYADNESGANLSALRTFLFLPFSFLFAFANSLLKSELLGKAGRFFLHALISVPSIFFLVILPGLGDTSGSEKLIGFIITMAAYFVTITLIFITKSRIKRLAEEEEILKEKNKTK